MHETLHSELLALIKIDAKLIMNYACKNIVVRSLKCVVRMPTEGFYISEELALSKYCQHFQEYGHSNSDKANPTIVFLVSFGYFLRGGGNSHTSILYTL